mmetsp:Transcript_9770/g.31366  ORF Transcript_9770/g.31366 Transcript_9770/m.31366 type:complete len:100 (-) Transcript_9770:490-789(-)
MTTKCLISKKLTKSIDAICTSFVSPQRPLLRGEGTVPSLRPSYSPTRCPPPTVLHRTRQQSQRRAPFVAIPQGHSGDHPFALLRACSRRHRSRRLPRSS